MEEPVLKKAKYGDGEECLKPAEEKSTQEQDQEAIKEPAAETCDDEDEETEPACVKEDDVGITQYLNDVKGFSGVIKQRYSDFLVNEIDLDGEVVHLTDMEIPADENKTQQKSETTESILQQWQSELQVLQDSKDTKKEVIIEAMEDKERRTSIHKAVKTTFANLETSTIEKLGKKCICAKWVQQKSVRRQGRPAWPKHKGDYISFVLFKENRDTMDAMSTISYITRIKSKEFSFAGTKDKRAKTSQEITAYRVPIEVLAGLNKNLDKRQIALGNFRYTKKQLRLGDLKGNRFSLILRNVQGETEAINDSLEALKDNGFINYFGMQRFGTTAIPTHHVGRELLKGNFQEAIDLILKPRTLGVQTHSNNSVIKAREVWWETKDPQMALKELRGRSCIERHLLVGLEKYPKHLIAALNTVPRNSRLMYLHSYQSYIWNVLVSRRLKKYGMKVLVGDLVRKTQDKSNGKQAPKHVDEESLSAYTIQDVVMPMPGYDIIYPKNEMGEWYKELMAEDGLEQGHLKGKHRDYSLPGDYRHLVVKPSDVKWDVCCYDDVTQALLLSDLDKIRGLSLPDCPPDGRFQAVRLEFSLPSSCYATMALREVLRICTSPGEQAKLNVV